MTKAIRAAARASWPAVLILAAAAAMILAFMVQQSPTARADPEPGAPDRVELETALVRIGVTPESLAAAGVSAETTALVIGAVAEHLEQHASSPESEDAALASAWSERDRLHAKARAGTATNEEIQSLASADAAFASAQSARGAVLEAMWGDAAGEMTGPQATMVARLHTVPEVFRGRLIPIEFGAAERSEADWVALREALAIERIALQDGESVPQETAALLSSARQQGEVSAAAANLAVLLPGVQAAWQQTLSTYE